MRPTLLYTGKHIVVTSRSPVLVNIDDRSMNLENRDHLSFGAVYDKGMDVARRLIDIAIFPSNPRMLKIPPASLNDETMDRLRVPVPGEDA
jgi:hypothetical protein